MATPEVLEEAKPAQPGRKPPRFGLGADGTSSPAGLILKIAVLAVVLAIAVWAALPLLANQRWVGLAIVVLVTALVFYIYLSPRQVPLKYLIPGTLFLIVFQIVPVLYTMSTAFTNFGDAHRGSKQDAITAIEGASVQQVPGSAQYVLSLATKGDPASGDIVFLLADPATQTAFVGTSEGLEELAAGDIQQAPTGKILAAPGYTVLNIGQANARAEDIAAFSVPTDKGAIKSQGLSRAFEGTPKQAYDAACDCIKDSETGQTTVSLVEALGATIMVHFEVDAPKVVTADTKLLEKDAHIDEAPPMRRSRGPNSWPPSPPAPGSAPATRSRSWSTPNACTSSTPTPAPPSGTSQGASRLLRGPVTAGPGWG